MVTLLIDTRNNTKVIVMLDKNGEMFECFSINQTHRPRSIVNLIEDVIKKAGITVSNIDEIKVEEGPGSYTGLKVGASVANTLSFALNKRINGNEIGKIIEPKYE